MTRQVALFALLPVSALFVVGCPADSAPIPEPPKPAPAGDVEAIVSSSNAFAFDLYGAVRKGRDGENLFFSPYSVTSALGMTWAGATGATAAEMQNTLRFDLPPERLHAGLGTLTWKLAGEPEGYDLCIANRLWGQRTGFQFKQPFLDLTRESYGAELELLDFNADTEGSRQRINDWVADRTNDLIQDLLPKGALTPETRLVLTNAIYFKGQWSEEFKPDLTKEADFTLASGKTQKVQLMHQTTSFRYAQLEGLKLLEMPYKGEAVSMIVLLPDAHDGLAAIEAKLDREALDGWVAKARSTEVMTWLPSFKLETDYALHDVLGDMGMPLAFDKDQAEFSGMAVLHSDQRLYVSKVLHKAFVEVNEEGTEAAAATAVVVDMVTTSVPPPPVEFRADHPFLFLIRDKKTGAILFMGRLADPS